MKFDKKSMSFISVVILIVAFIVSYPFILFNSEQSITLTINDKERITTGSGENLNSKYLIYTNEGVFENTDTLWYWKYDSSDVYNGLTIGETFTVTTAGWRVPWLSWYPNIIEITGMH